MFLPWADPADYALTAQGALGGWGLQNVSLSSDHDPYTSGRYSLSMAAGNAQALSPTMCVNLTNPTIRLFAKDTGGNGKSDLNVTVLYEDLNGKIQQLQLARLRLGSSWQPTIPIPIGVNLLSTASASGVTAVAFLFRPEGLQKGETITIDNLYVDPFCSRYIRPPGPCEEGRPMRPPFLAMAATRAHSSDLNASGPVHRSAEGRATGVLGASAWCDGARPRDPRATRPLRLGRVPRPRRLPADRGGGARDPGGAGCAVAGRFTIHPHLQPGVRLASSTHLCSSGRCASSRVVTLMYRVRLAASEWRWGVEVCTAEEDDIDRNVIGGQLYDPAKFW